MLYLHRGRCQELQFSTKQKSGEYFGTRAYLVPGKRVACPHIMRGFFIEGGSQRGFCSGGCQSCCGHCSGFSGERQRAETAPGITVPFYTRVNLISSL